MTKRRKNYNIRHKKGGKIDSSTAHRRKPARARPISTGAAAVVESPLLFLAYTFGVILLLCVIKWLL